MRLQVKRWGNGVVLRPPRESPEYGRLEVGDVVDVTIAPQRAAKRWKPYVVRSVGVQDASTRHDELAWSYLAQKWPKRGP